MDCKIIKYFLIIFFINFNVSAVEFKGKFIQGHFIIGKTDPDSKIKIDKKQIRVSKDGYFAFGLSRDRKYDIVITIEKNGVKIMGESNILNKLPNSASNLYAKNVFNFVLNLYDKDNKKLNINLEDEIINKTLLQ